MPEHGAPKLIAQMWSASLKRALNGRDDARGGAVMPIREKSVGVGDHVIGDADGRFWIGVKVMLGLEMLLRGWDALLLEDGQADDLHGSDRRRRRQRRTGGPRTTAALIDVGQGEIESLVITYVDSDDIDGVIGVAGPR